MQRSLEALELQVQSALSRQDDSELDVVGSGEISPVLRLVAAGKPYAVKRLPLFASEARLQGYVETFESYIATLRDVGIQPLRSTIAIAARKKNGVVAYCVQPLIDSESLCVTRLRTMDLTPARRFGAELFGVIAGAVSERVGLDAQLSNWFVRGESNVARELGYLDLTTPLLRDAAGEERLDTELFLASLPAALRPLVRRFMLSDILANYYDLRSVLRDLLGNLIKEELEQHLDGWLGIANERVTPELTMTEVRAHYAEDARTWALLQRLRRADRGWQRYVRRRAYGFLLPGDIQRQID
ncbi:MAG: hypothetical protein KC492_42130 [Myxococcales bacterium]|nr:hypothetical protein [Myxococcales bacterium]